MRDVISEVWEVELWWVVVWWVRCDERCDKWGVRSGAVMSCGVMRGWSGAAGAGTGAAGSKRKTRTPHSDLGK